VYENVGYMRAVGRRWRIANCQYPLHFLIRPFKHTTAAVIKSIRKPKPTRAPGYKRTGTRAQIDKRTGTRAQIDKRTGTRAQIDK
jgi:hypothetical protein